MTDNLPANDTPRFLYLFHRAKATYEDSAKRLAAEGWNEPWQVVISTIMSAQNRDESTIKTATSLFEAYPELEDLAHADYDDVLSVFSSINYNKSKADYVITTAQRLVSEHNGSVPDDIDALLDLKGVGRKTANLVLSTVFQQPAICVDTHVHRISNVFDLVDTDKPAGTEDGLQQVAPRQYWRHINRYFVLWGQAVPGHDQSRLLDPLRPLPESWSESLDEDTSVETAHQRLAQ